MQRPALLGGPPVRDRPFPPWPQHGPEEEKALLETLRSGNWFEHAGDRVEGFARAFAAEHEARFGITTNAGTTALWLALFAAGVRAGDEVILPTYTFVASATSILMLGAIPVFVDVEPDTFNLDPALVEAAVTPRTKAVMPVHFGGYPADLDALEAIAQRHGLAIVEDACHAHGGVYRGRKLGAQGDLGAFSFQQSKNMTAGEGGIILTNKEDLADICWTFKMYGRPRGACVWYDHGGLGGNFRMTEFQAALLQCQLARLEAQTQRRWENARLLELGMRELPGLHPQGREDPRVTRRAYHLFSYRYDAAALDGLPRDLFLKALNAEGIPGWIGYGMPLHKQPLFTDRERLARECPTTRGPDGLPPNYAALETPVAERLCAEQAIWMLHSVLLGTPDDMRDILNAMEKIIAQRRTLLDAHKQESA